MNYLQARELRDAEGNPRGLWHFTSQNDGRIHAVGYCSPWEECPACKGHSMTAYDSNYGPCSRCDSKGVIEVEHPCPGHPTPEEAVEHFWRYQLDKRTNYDGRVEDSQHRCRICETWTQRFARVDWHWQAWLCDEHCNRENVEKLYNKPSIIISS